MGAIGPAWSNSSSRPASGETCSTHQSSERQAYQMTCVHVVAGLPREYHSLRRRRRRLHSGVDILSRY
eukprot:1010437-Pyramimonas_sp.AAC.1